MPSLSKARHAHNIKAFTGLVGAFDPAQEQILMEGVAGLEQIYKDYVIQVLALKRLIAEYEQETKALRKKITCGMRNMKQGKLVEMKPETSDSRQPRLRQGLAF